MNARKMFWLVAVVLAVFSLVGCGGASGSVVPIKVVSTASGEVSFVGTVLPILQDHCKRCHAADRKGGLDVMSYDGVLKGGNRGPSVVAGDPDKSQLVGSVEKTMEPYMPPRVFAALTPDRIQAIRQWIKEGAKNN